MLVRYNGHLKGRPCCLVQNQIISLLQSTVLPSSNDVAKCLRPLGLAIQPQELLHPLLKALNFNVKVRNLKNGFLNQPYRNTMNKTMPPPPFVSFSGERKSIVSCMQIVNKTMMLVNDSICQQVTRPQPQVRRCNAHPCQSR